MEHVVALAATFFIGQSLRDIEERVSKQVSTRTSDVVDRELRKAITAKDGVNGLLEELTEIEKNCLM